MKRRSGRGKRNREKWAKVEPEAGVEDIQVNSAYGEGEALDSYRVLGCVEPRQRWEIICGVA